MPPSITSPRTIAIAPCSRSKLKHALSWPQQQRAVKTTQFDLRALFSLHPSCSRFNIQLRPSACPSQTPSMRIGSLPVHQSSASSAPPNALRHQLLPLLLVGSPLSLRPSAVLLHPRQQYCISHSCFDCLTCELNCSFIVMTLPPPFLSPGLGSSAWPSDRCRAPISSRRCQLVNVSRCNVVTQRCLQSVVEFVAAD